ncbi:phytanoyl-CoA dioxygenase family protein [Cryptosporangium arvum]|uniref:phytanoyl-CoA dioxygenase family protein n=1 Tax=Cryptosporangium arvum TaxID=80871 RepID=UPI0004B6D985|nr:phytanoyl-CoA dioxygenase family protein [Cryptosporangium arvum]
MWFSHGDCRVEHLAALVDTKTSSDDYPFASSIEENVLIYDANRLPDPVELSRALSEGPGVVMITGAFADLSIVDRATAVFDAIIADQPAGGDHFAPPGANDRVWNALEKLALRAPDVFAEYYANDVVARVATAWLGPGYQVTSQVNVVNPGGAAQNGHRDYHLGFMSAAQAARYPAAVHSLSPRLTLQGAVAHCDMPVESGPTMYLPHSQKYEPGYLAIGRPEFQEYFQEHHVQLPLRKGDAVFFNPALMHAAGTNRSAGVRRMANLLQISSAFGRAMESVDRERMCTAVYPFLIGMADPENVIAATAEGYAFPTNLDRDQPVDGLAPPSQADVVRRAVAEQWPPDALRDRLAAHSARRR